MNVIMYDTDKYTIIVYVINKLQIYAYKYDQKWIAKKSWGDGQSFAFDKHESDAWQTHNEISPKQHI